jgi:hypothetical protein
MDGAADDRYRALARRAVATTAAVIAIATTVAVTVIETMTSTTAVTSATVGVSAAIVAR